MKKEQRKNIKKIVDNFKKELSDLDNQQFTAIKQYKKALDEAELKNNLS